MPKLGNKKQQLHNNTCTRLGKPQDGGDEETDNEMQNYEEELQQCAKALGIHYQRVEEADPASDNATDSSKMPKKRKQKGKLHTRTISQEHVPLPDNLTSMIQSEVYSKNVFEEMAHLAAFKARFQQKWGNQNVDSHWKITLRYWRQVNMLMLYTKVLHGTRNSKVCVSTGCGHRIKQNAT